MRQAERAKVVPKNLTEYIAYQLKIKLHRSNLAVLFRSESWERKADGSRDINDFEIYDEDLEKVRAFVRRGLKNWHLLSLG